MGRRRHLTSDRRSFLLGAAVVLVLAAAAVPAARAEAISLTLEDDAVVVSSLPPGDTVAVLGVSRRAVHSIVRTERRDEWLVDEDLDGEVRLPLSGPPPEQSLWLAVSLSTGEWVTATGAPEVGGPLVVGVDGEVEAAAELVQAGTFYELLLARPGDEPSFGAWGGALADGAAGDLDGTLNRSVAFGPAALTPVGASPPPSAAFEPGDLVVVIDPSTLHFGIETVQEDRDGEEGAR